MTATDLKYVQQILYSGGINVQPEIAGPNQVIDASNYWTPLSRCDRRPGITSYPGALTLTGNTSVVGGLSWPNGTYNIGQTINFSGTIAAGLIGGEFIDSIFSNSVYTLGGGYTQVLVAWQIYTARGWVGLTGYVSNASASTYASLEVLKTVSNNTMSFMYPTDYLPEPVTGYALRGIITGAYNGSAFVTSGSNALTLNNVFPFNLGFNSTTVGTSGFIGAYREEFASGIQIIDIGVGGAVDIQPAGFRIPPSIGLSVTGITNRDIPTVAVIPEFNTAYIAVHNQVIETPYGVAPRIATVNQDPLIVGPSSITGLTTSIYPSDQIPQQNSFPAANLIIYFRDRLWCADILNQPQTVQWAAAVDSINGPAYNVWPSVSQALLSDARDNSPITAIAALADNLVVFKKNSIWLMIDNGTDINNLALFEPRLIVAGVGCLAQNSVKAIPGGLMFLAEDGFYLFDGTPNIKRVSDPVKTYISRISPARAPFAQAVNWRTNQYYLCAVSLDGEMNSNNYVFAYDYQSDAWWIWTGWDVQCWYQDDGVGLREEIWFFDRYGRASKLQAGDTDNGTPITCFLTTERFGEFDILSKDVREIRVQSINQADILAPPSVDIITDDITTTEGANHAINLPLDGETLWADPPVSGTSTWVPERRRERKIPVRVTGKWFQMKIKNVLQVVFIAAGYLPDSRR